VKEIAIVGFVQAFFFSVLIIAKKKKETQDYFLISFLILVGAELFYKYNSLGQLNDKNSWLEIFDFTFWALFGPICLIYTYLTIGRVKLLRLRMIIHLCPLLIALYGVKDYFLGETLYSSYLSYFNESSGLILVSLLLLEYISPIYVIFSLILLYKHKFRVRNFYSNISGKEVRWLMILILGFIFFVLFSYSISIYEEIANQKLRLQTNDILPVILTICIFFIGYFGYRQKGVFYSDSDDLQPDNTFFKAKKYLRSGLSEDEKKELILRINRFMQTEKPYIECDLRMGDLAEMLGTESHKLSQILNESFNQNFYDFINKYRVEESMKILRDPESIKFKIMSIAYDSGFSSKSSFYNAFRKINGITPGKYQKKVHSSVSIAN